MNKLHWAIVPPCITFGPLFMTRIAGLAERQYEGSTVFVGVLMLAIGLVIMFRILNGQQKLIEALQSELRVKSDKRPAMD